MRKSDYGIFVPFPVCRDPNLSPAARIVYGQVAQLAKKEGYCYASNTHLAKQCGLNRDTVSAAVGKLVGKGLLTVEQHRSRRRIRVVNCGQIPQQPRAETAVATAENDRGCAENGPTPAENGLGHLKIEVKYEEKNEDNDKASSSSVDSDRNRPGEVKPAGDRAAETEIVQAWAKQAASRMGRRTWKHRQADGSEKVYQLGVPHPAKPTGKELIQLASLANKLWSGCDRLLGIRQLLRACAWTSDRRDKLQQYAYMASGGSLGVRGVLRLGGQAEPLAFIRDCAATVPPPPPPVVPGTPADAEQLRQLAYGTGDWSGAVWSSSWLEAAGRCQTIGSPPQFYMAAVYHLYEKGAKTMPLPWIADSITLEDLRDFDPLYQADRINAWNGGSCRPHGDPRISSGNYTRCIGRTTAEAVIAGRTQFRNRSCLKCVAAEVRLIPELAQCVKWKLDPEDLAKCMDTLAAQTTSDDPPIRGAACGQDDCDPPSYIRCFHGSAEGAYLAGDSQDDPAAVNSTAGVENPA